MDDALVPMGDSEDFMPQWPPLGAGVQRSVYVEGAPRKAREVLEGRGYTVVEINTLPRNTDAENKQYLSCKAQGIGEGTIQASENDRKVLELEMRAFGLLDRKTWSIKANATITKDDVAELLGWGRSRHTLANNSTVVSAQKLTDAAKKG